jgi:hypothetical protein
MEITKFEVDKEASVEGVWIDLEEYGYDVEVKVARWNNPKFLNALQRMTDRPGVKQKVEKNKLDFEEQERIMAYCIARYILLDWKGMTRDGEPLPYSPEEGERAMLGLPDFKEVVREQAQDLELFRKARIEERGKD